MVAGIGGVALFVFLFFDWVSAGAQITGVFGGTTTISHPGVSGWDYLTDAPGFVIILSGVSGIVLAYLAAAGQRVNLPFPRGAVTAYLGALAVLLILWRMFAGSPTLKIGIFLGLAAAVAITAGAFMSLAEDGYSPLVAVAGGRTKAVAASAPAAVPSAPPAEAPTTEAPAKKSSGSATKRRSTAKKSGGSRSSSSKSKSSSSKARGSSRSGGSRSGGTRKRSSGGRK
jgi:hypothetical protein